MTTLFLEGFDTYGPNQGVNAPTGYITLLEAAGWSFSGLSSVGISPSLNGEPGYSVTFGAISGGSGTTMSKNLGANYSSLVGGFRFSESLQGFSGLVFFDNLTAQCSLIINPLNGRISFNQGDLGPELQLSAAGVASNTVHELEYEVVFAPAPFGGWQVWLDGVSILSGTGTTIQTANSYASGIGLRHYSVNLGNFIVDDMYMFDTTTGFNNAVLLSNPIILTDVPIADSSIAFVALANVVGYPYSVNFGVYGFNANSMYLVPFTPNAACSLQSVVVGNTEFGSTTCKFKAVLYSNASGNVPGTLLASGVEVIGTAAGAPQTFPFSSGQALTAGTKYWLGVIGDSNINFAAFDNLTFNAWEVANTYSSGAPSTAPAGNTAQTTAYIYGACINATTNWETQALNPPIGDASSVVSGMVGSEDLYTFPALPTLVETVYDVAVTGYARLTYAGSHTINLLAKSSTTTSSGSNPGIVPTLNYAYYETQFNTDPATSGAWTPTAAGNAKLGEIIAS